ncbi:hypothetical protein ACFL4W_02195 [Planctomycetota bacterium]
MKLEVATPLIILALVIGRVVAGIIARKFNPRATTIKIRNGEITISGKELSEPFDTVIQELEKLELPQVSMTMESSFSKEGGVKIKLNVFTEKQPGPNFDGTEFLPEAQKILLKYKPTEYNGIVNKES